MRLSFSTMRLLHECPHCYVNKMFKIKQPESIYLVEGKIAHGIMQRHVSDVEEHPAFAHIGLKFPVVEKIDFDPDCKFEVPFGKHTIIGFIDGLDKRVDEKPTVMLEGKFSSSPWSLGKYKKDPQRKIYGWAMRSVKTAYLITGKRTPEEWETIKPVTRKVDFTEQDYKDAEDYMSKAIKMIEEKDFYGDLDNGVCTSYNCWYGANCMFKPKNL